ncbi:hypothetical protein ACJB7Y_001207 [Staphylococcus pseudintermedius]
MSFIKKLNANQYLHIFEAYEKGYSFQYIINALNIDINPQTLSYKYRIIKRMALTYFYRILKEIVTLKN